MIRNPIVAGVAAAVVALAGVAVTAGPASAAQSDCPSGYACLWLDQNYTNTLYKNSGSPNSVTNNDTASSLYNRQSTSVIFWEDINHVGRTITFASGGAANSLAAYNTNLGTFETSNDRISSFSH
ncbi:peptidase inhibitor family I36 protein [Galbitalea soli]|uniref:Peptidase inhibitor family I36 protein n=1 Tax=Galbitalea soli TaxID=1268042 RepID=A0A7C9TRB9_9MICO|nr:peptidase inhibitor family I36 protein [Galbitalea soli]NEM91380.1 peptidase inhibitor family I36 protein [Galbitalea soli]NYJ30071.1 hypothetical protein [Galbitalea soli]